MEINKSKSYIEKLKEIKGKDVSAFLFELLLEAESFEKSDHKFVFKINKKFIQDFSDRANLWSLMHFVSSLDIDYTNLKEPKDKYDCIIIFENVNELFLKDSIEDKTDKELNIAKIRFVYFLYYIWLHNIRNDAFTRFIKGLFI